MNKKIKMMIILFDFREDIDFSEIFYFNLIKISEIEKIKYYRNKTESEIKNIICNQILFN